MLGIPAEVFTNWRFAVSERRRDYCASQRKEHRHGRGSFNLEFIGSLADTSHVSVCRDSEKDKGTHGQGNKIVSISVLSQLKSVFPLTSMVFRSSSMTEWMSAWQSVCVNRHFTQRIAESLSIGAAGLHVGQTDMPVDLARTLLPKDTIIGISVSNVKEAKAAVASGLVDYVGIGAVWWTGSKDLKGKLCLGVDGVGEVLDIIAEGEMENGKIIRSVAIGKSHTYRSSTILQIYRRNSPSKLAPTSPWMPFADTPQEPGWHRPDLRHRWLDRSRERRTQATCRFGFVSPCTQRPSRITCGFWL